MTIDPETLMAYADGELDEVAVRRVERAVSADPALAETVAAHRRLAARLAHGFAPVVAAGAPTRFAALLEPATVVTMPARRARWWPTAAAIAASLVVGVLTGQAIRPSAPIATDARGLFASGELARALDTQLTADSAPSVRMIASFRDGSGALCRAFVGVPTSGIACRADHAWLLRRTASGAPAQSAQYRQAGSPDAAILAAAQDMMAGTPLDAAQERVARDAAWR